MPSLANCSGVPAGSIRAEAASAAPTRDEQQFAFSPRSLEGAAWKAFGHDGDPRGVASGATSHAAASRARSVLSSWPSTTGRISVGARPRTDRNADSQLYVNLSAVLAALSTLFTIALTSTVPISCAGETAVHFLLELQTTEVAFTVPK